MVAYLRLWPRCVAIACLLGFTSGRFMVGQAQPQPPFQATLDAQPSLATASEVFWASIFTRCGDSLYFLSSKGKDAVLYEYRGPFHYGVRESILSPNDQLNGIQAKGNANFNASAVRMMYPKGASTASVGGQWTPWKGGDVSGNGEAAGPARSVLMTRKSGHWELMGGTALQGTDAVVGSRISCESATSASPLADFDQASVRPTLVVAISGNAQVAKLVKKTKPIYPQVAQDKHVGGRVTFTVMIDQEGKVQDVKLVSGHPLLVQAAREAVLQWEYAPTIINGNPVGVSTTINVDFALAH